MRIGLVGAGTAALRAHLPALTRAAEADEVTVAAVVDPQAEHRDEVRRRCPGAEGFATVGAMLDGVALDLVVVASPPSSHLAAVRAAFEAEVDVVCEKPLGVAHEDPDALAVLTAAHPRRALVPVHQYRFAPAWRHVAAVWEAHRGDDDMRLCVEVERPGTDPLSSGGWRAAGLREGGVLGDHGVHYLALAWTLDRRARLVGATVEGEAGSETAAMELDLDGGTASIAVSYAGARRRNLVEVSRAGAPLVRWLDGELLHINGDEVRAAPTAALSDRQAVNDLYADLYDELLIHRSDAAWRAERTGEALEVAALLSAALDSVRAAG